MAKPNRGGQRGVASEKQAKTLNTIARKIKNLKHEQLYVVDSDGNVVLHKKSKDTGEVTFTRGEARDTFKGNITIHNHPAVDGIAGTFSAEDLGSFAYGAKQIQVSSADGRYIMTNRMFGTKKQYDGWYDMQEKLNSIKESFPSGLKARDLARKQPHIAKMEDKMKRISDAWVKAKDSGDKKSMDSLMKQYDEISKKYKSALATEKRRQEVKPYDDFYRKNAAKYGFSYKFIKGK